MPGVTVVVGKQRQVVNGEFKSIGDLKEVIKSTFDLKVKSTSLRLIHKGKIKADNEQFTQDMWDGTVMVMLPPLTKSSCPCFPTQPLKSQPDEAAVAVEHSVIELTTLGFFQAATKFIKVKHGRRVFNVQTDDKCTGLILKKAIASHFGTVPASIRLFAKGATISDNELLTGVSEAMLLFSSDYNSQLSGDAWIDQLMSEISSIEIDLVAFEKAIAHRATTSSIEAQYTLNSITDRIETSRLGIDRIKVTKQGEEKAAILSATLTELASRARVVNLTPHR